MPKAVEKAGKALPALKKGSVLPSVTLLNEEDKEVDVKVGSAGGGEGLSELAYPQSHVAGGVRARPTTGLAGLSQPLGTSSVGCSC